MPHFVETTWSSPLSLPGAVVSLLHPLSSLFLSLLLPMEEQCPYLDEPLFHEPHGVRDAQHRDRISDRFLHRVTPFRIVMRVVRVFRGAICHSFLYFPALMHRAGR